jgi:WD40-like Beta Propeller Repeat
VRTWRVGWSSLLLAGILSACSLVTTGGKEWSSPSPSPSNPTSLEGPPIDLSSLPGRIAFVSSRDDPNRFDCSPCNMDIFVMRPDGSHVRRLTSGPAIDTGATFSPDGSEIAFERVSPACLAMVTCT